MKRNFKAYLLLCGAMLMSSCGGGGGSSYGNSSVPGVTQADVLTVAKVGALYNEALTRFYTMHLLFAASYLQGFSSNTGGTSSTVGTACPNGGSFDINVTRTGTYTGLHAGDAITTAFHQCNLGSGIADGSMNIVPAANYASLTAPYTVQFSLRETNLTLNIGGLIMRGNMTTSVTATVNPNNDFSYSYNSGSPASFDVFAAGNSTPTLSVTHGTPSGSASLLSSVMSTVNNGTVAISTQGTSFSYQVSVSPALSGPAPVGSNPFVPTSGAFRMSQGTGLPSGASLTATVNGAVVSIAADTNGDGTADMNFNTTYAALLAP